MLFKTRNPLTRRTAALGALAVALGALAGCSNSTSSTTSSSSSSSSSTAAASTTASADTPDLKTGWMFYGPKNDGGWNVANWQQAQPALKADQPGYSQLEVDNVPYSAQATQLAQSLIGQGAKVMIDVIGLGDLFTNVCAKQTSIHCFETAPIAKMPPNTTGYWAPAQVPEYTAGVAAGLSTKTNTIGYIAAYPVPLILGGINAFTMGCRSVNPKCTVRVVQINDYFNPPKTTQAAQTLVDSGADVIRGWTDDPSYCTTARQRGILAIPNFADASTQCGDALITSTVWDFKKFFTSQLKAIGDGAFQQQDLDFVEPKDVYSLGTWGSKVSASTKQKVQETLDGLISGKLDPFTGPISDATGKVRVPAGKTLDNTYIYSQWKWPVAGVVRSKG